MIELISFFSVDNVFKIAVIVFVAFFIFRHSGLRVRIPPFIKCMNPFYIFKRLNKISQSVERLDSFNFNNELKNKKAFSEIDKRIDQHVKLYYDEKTKEKQYLIEIIKNEINSEYSVLSGTIQNILTREKNHIVILDSLSNRLLKAEKEIQQLKQLKSKTE